MEQLNFTNSSNISSAPGHPPPASWDSSGLVPAVVLSLCFILGAPGNIAVMVLKPNWQQLSKLTQCLMVNLAMSDLLCLLTLPLWIHALLYGWTFGLVACKILSFFVYCCVYGSLLTVTAVSAQRYLQVTHQQKCLQIKRRLLVLLWLVSMTISIPALVLREPTQDKPWKICQPLYSSKVQEVVVLLSETFVGFGAFAVIAFSYIGLNKKVKQAAFFNNSWTSKLVTSIIVTFLVLWMPYHLLNVLGVAAISLNNEGLYQFFYNSSNIVGAVTFLNSCLNPLLYAFASQNMCPWCRKSPADNAEA